MPDQTAPLRYVVLHHTGFEAPHFDLMFEISPGSRLMTWRAAKWPLETGDLVEQLADHRHDYLDYEGPISNRRGHVRRVFAGRHHVLMNSRDRFMMTGHGRDGLELSLDRVEGRTWRCEVNEM